MPDRTIALYVALTLCGMLAYVAYQSIVGAFRAMGVMQ